MACDTAQYIDDELDLIEEHSFQKPLLKSLISHKSHCVVPVALALKRPPSTSEKLVFLEGPRVS
jgi:hypothetical protein